MLIAVALGCAGFGLAQSAPKAASPKAGAAKPAAAKTAAKARAAPPKRYVQMQPAPERYRQIQQALADRGFFEGPIDGNWGPPSVDALKRFEHAENIEEDGRMNAQALIHLGLGPQRAAAVQAEPAQTPAEPRQ